MARSRRQDPARAQAIKRMGGDLGALYYALSGELVWLNWEWAQYTKLFATKQSRLDLLNDTAPFFFAVVQRLLWHNTLLSLSRLAGPSKSAGKANLSIRRLPEAVSDVKLRRMLVRLVNRAVKASQFSTVWRNKYLAHRDLDRALGRRAGRLPVASQKRVEAALSAIASVLNAVQLPYEKATTHYHSALVQWDADTLLAVLRDGQIREKLREKRLDAGEYSAEDWNDDLPAV